MSKIIFIGGILEGQLPNCGETVKNQLLIAQLKALGHSVITIDTVKWRKNPFVLVKMLLVLMFNRGAKVIISASGAASYLISFLHYIPLKKSVYFWVIGGNLHYSVANGKYNIKALQKLKWILVEGDNMKQSLEKLGLNNVKVVPNFKPIKSPNIVQNLGDEACRKFVFMSRIYPDKGVKEIVKAVDVLNGRGYSDRFVVDFYGLIEPMFEPEFNLLVTSYQNITYNGFLNLQSISGYEQLSKYDMMLFPTYWDGEGFPGVVLDANMAGVPIIASDWSMNREVVKDGYTGFIIPTHDTEALVESMRCVIDGSVDLVQMKRNCLEWVQKYDVKNVVSAELLEKIGMLE